jgi:hypothetical protein
VGRCRRHLAALADVADPGLDLSHPGSTLGSMWKRWYQVLVEIDGKRHLIAIEAASAIEARQIVAADWGDESVRGVKSLR